MQTSEELLKITQSLLSTTERVLIRFEQAKSTGEKGDFYTEVKPFADEVKQKTSEWRVSALAWIGDHKQRNLHSRQIESTAENIEMVSIQAFFPTTSRKRFIGHIQSIEYVLNGLLEAIKRNMMNANQEE